MNTSNLVPLDVRTYAKQDLDGLTVSSEEFGLPGPLRNLAWVVVSEDASTFTVNFLYDTPDANAAVDAALEYAPGVYGYELVAGAYMVTLGDIADAKVGIYPEELDIASVEAALSDPELVSLVVSS
jgi:hypothetical protein